MRCWAFFVVVVLLWMPVMPPGAATQPTGPYWIAAQHGGDPRVGGEVQVIATFTNHHAGEGPFRFRIEKPDWVSVASSPNWTFESERGTQQRRAWVLTPERPGVWSYQISRWDEEIGEWRYGTYGASFWSGENESLTQGKDDLQLFPEGGAVSRLVAREGPSGKWTLEYEMRPTAPWLQGADLTMSLRAGSGEERSTSPLWEEDNRLTIELPEPQGHDVLVMADAWATLSFEDPRGQTRTEHVMVDCRSLTLGDPLASFVSRNEGSSCIGDSHATSAPAALWLPLTAVALLALARPTPRRLRRQAPPRRRRPLSPTCGTV